MKISKIVIVTAILSFATLTANPAFALTRSWKSPPSAYKCRVGMYIKSSWTSYSRRSIRGTMFKVRSYAYCEGMRFTNNGTVTTVISMEEGMHNARRNARNEDTNSGTDRNLYSGLYEYMWVSSGTCYSMTRYIQALAMVDESIAGLHYGNSRSLGQNFSLALCAKL